ncbi:MAG: FAD-binding oxidoreductase [Candidatus Lokiarchaeota archaeon]|nr:FAD-binding oxidoreductase [Candidatus Lokiarchaeota archaeon]
MTISKKSNAFEKIGKAEVLSRLIDIFGSTNVSNKQVDLYPYSYDMTENEPHMPDFVVIPENKEQLVELVIFCNQYAIPIVPYTSGNNVGGLTIPDYGGIIVDFGKKMNKIIHVNGNMMYALIEPGVTFGQLQKYLEENYPHLRYSYPNAPPYAGVMGNALLSGMTNLGAKIGSMADSVNGLEVIMADGDIVRIGSCFYGKEEADLNSWWSRYPMPDLLGLFVNWQGMTGLVTKCAVQLWPKEPVEKPQLAIFFGLTDLAPFLREVGKIDIINDIAAFSVEVAKMEVGIPEPVKYPEEPYYTAVIPISAKNEEHLNVKLNLLNEIVEKLNHQGTNIHLIDYNEFSKLYDLKARNIYDLPSQILSLHEYSGLTWFGAYAPTDKFEELIEKTDKIYKKHGFPPFNYLKIMKGGHYGIFRPIFRFKRFTERERVFKLAEEIADTCIALGCIPYKTPSWLTAKLREKINPGWIRLFEKVKRCLDPNNIFNPGRWNTSPSSNKN